MSDIDEELRLWSAFVARVKLTFAFRIDILVQPCSRATHADRVEMGVNLHVPDRDTREPITVLTRRPCGPWTSDTDALEMLFDLIEIALKHETSESAWLDGKLVRDLHAAVTP